MLHKFVRYVCLSTLIMCTVVGIATAQELDHLTNQARSSRERFTIVTKVIEPAGGDQFQITKKEPFRGTITLAGGVKPYKKFQATGTPPAGITLKPVDADSDGFNETFELATSAGPVDAKDFVLRFKGKDHKDKTVNLTLSVPVVDQPIETQGIDLSILNPELEIPQRGRATFIVEVRGLAGFDGVADLTVFSPNPNIFAQFAQTRIVTGQRTTLDVGLFNELDLKTYELIVVARTLINNRPVSDTALAKIKVIESSGQDIPMITTVDLDFLHAQKRETTTVIEAKGGDGQYTFAVIPGSSTTCDCEIETRDNKGYLKQHYRLPDTVQAQVMPQTLDEVLSQTYYLVSKVLIAVSSAGRTIQYHFNYFEYRGPRYYGVDVHVTNGFEFRGTDTMQVSVRYDGNLPSAEILLYLGHPECQPGQLKSVGSVVLAPGQTRTVSIPVQILGQGYVCDPHIFQVIGISATESQIAGVSQDLSFYR